MPVDDSKFTHIVGMYKCGTSWLSHILAAHPAIISWREFDIIRATHTQLHHPLLNRAAYRVARLLKLPPPNMPAGEFISKNKEEIIREIFCGRGWIPMMDEEKRAKAATLDYADSGHFIDTLMALSEKNFRGDDTPQISPERFSNVLGAVNSRRKDLVTFLDAIKNSQDTTQVTHYFLEFLQQQCKPGTPIVLKAADQLISLQQLQQYSPHSRKIAIIRDGRDAAISAIHYRKLMQKRDAPWAQKEEAYLGQVRGWATRARMLANWAEKNSEHVVRKGITGEWINSLDKKTADLAWRIAGGELERFGYTREGEYQGGISGLIRTT